MHIAQFRQELQLLHLESSSLGSVKRFPAINCGGAAVPDADSYIYQSSTAAKLCLYVCVMYNLY